MLFGLYIRRDKSNVARNCNNNQLNGYEQRQHQHQQQQQQQRDAIAAMQKIYIKEKKIVKRKCEKFIQFGKNLGHSRGRCSAWKRHQKRLQKRSCHCLSSVLVCVCVRVCEATGRAQVQQRTSGNSSKC